MELILHAHIELPTSANPIFGPLVHPDMVEKLKEKGCDTDLCYVSASGVIIYAYHPLAKTYFSIHHTD